MLNNSISQDSPSSKIETQIIQMLTLLLNESPEQITTLNFSEYNDNNNNSNNNSSEQIPPIYFSIPFSSSIWSQKPVSTAPKAPVVRDGNDVAIVASGIMLHEAIKAADELAKEGISAAVLNAFTWKPLDNETIPAYAKKCGAVVTAENHNVIGGLGSAVAHCLAMNCPTPMEMVGVQDIFGEVGTEDYLRNRFDLTAAEIVKKAKAAIAKK